MSHLPEPTTLRARLCALESALSSGAQPENCLRMLREILVEPAISEPPAWPAEQAAAGRLDAFGAAVLQALPTQIAVLDGRGAIVAVNDTWNGFARANGGGTLDGLGVGANYLDVCRSAITDGCEEAGQAAGGIQAVLDGELPLFALEYPCHSVEQRRWFLMQVTPLDLKPRGALAIHLDVTQRRLAEDQARRQQAQLAKLARQHTVGALASAVAHEISQPLAAIGMYSNAAAHLLESGKASPDEIAEVLRQIESQVARAGEIVARVREVTRWRTAEKTVSDLRETLDEAIRMTRPLAAERRVAISLDSPETPVPVPADRIQIAQVLVNLLCNSIEAIERAQSAERRVAVAVGWDGARALVTVADSGPGIRPGWGERMFDIFETDEPSAAGMGLTIARSLVEGHGGRLWADIQSPHGAVFYFTLPGIQDVQNDGD